MNQEVEPSGGQCQRNAGTTAYSKQLRYKKCVCDILNSSVLAAKMVAGYINPVNGVKTQIVYVVCQTKLQNISGRAAQ